MPIASLEIFHAAKLCRGQSEIRIPPERWEPLANEKTLNFVFFGKILHEKKPNLPKGSFWPFFGTEFTKSIKWPVLS